MKHRVKTLKFTLVEILIVLILLSMGIALTGVKIKEAYQEQRFLSEAQMVANHLSMAQDLMMIMNTDVRMILSSKRTKQGRTPKNSEELNVWLEVDKPLDKHWIRLIERQLKLKAIHALEFDGEKKNEIVLLFSFGRMSQGKLILYNDKDSKQSERTFEIDLLGYPRPIGLKESEKEAGKEVRSEILYPKEVYDKLYEKSNETDEAP